MSSAEVSALLHAVRAIQGTKSASFGTSDAPVSNAPDLFGGGGKKVGSVVFTLRACQGHRE